VLNPKSASAATKPDDDDDDDDDDVTVPEMTPVIEQFSKLPLGGFSKSWDFIKEHRDVVVPGASDALLVAAFRAERAGNHAYAKQCAHQSLLLQYGEKLGRDGVTVFFRKYVSILSFMSHTNQSTVLE
jgi:cell division cycle protein 37